MRATLALMCAFLCNSVFAKDIDPLKVDLNKDGIIDRFEYRNKKNILTKVEEDRNGDKKVDRVTEFDQAGVKELVLEDNDFDGKFERQTTFNRLPEKKKIKVTTKLDKDGDGKFEVSYVKHIELKQNDTVDCAQVPHTSDLGTLPSDALRAGAELNNGFINTGTGFSVHSSCVDRWGTDIFKDIKSTVKKGLSCLENLHGDNEGITGALQNAYDLSQLFKDDKAQLLCHQKEGYDWEGTLGHASASAEETIESLGVSHPYISLNPSLPNESGSPTQEDKSEFRKTLFHEAFHNIGHLHGHGFEFAYSCEECCLGDDSDTAKRNMACKICEGDYESVGDERYVEDLIHFSQSNFRPFLGHDAAQDFAKENAGTAKATLLLALSNYNEFNPVGPSILKAFKAKGLTLSKKDERLLKKLEKTDNYSSVDESSAHASNVLGEAIVDYYFSGNPKLAMQKLQKEKEKFKTVYKYAIENEDYAAQDIKNAIEKITFDMFVNGYLTDTNEDLGMMAYDTFMVFEEMEEELESSK